MNEEAIARVGLQPPQKKYYIVILWDHRRICCPSLTETSLCGAYLYSFITEVRWDRVLSYYFRKWVVVDEKGAMMA